MPNVFLCRHNRHVALMQSVHRSNHLLLVLPLMLLLQSIWTDLLFFFLTSCWKYTAYPTYYDQRSQICFLNKSSYFLPSIDPQTVYYVPHSYSLLRDSSSCVGQMAAQSVGCIGALKEKFFLTAFY